MALELSGRCDSIQLKVYTEALVLVREINAPGPSAAGWVKVPLPSLGLAAGTYFCEAGALQGGRISTLKTAKLFFLR
jgi:hypothetical protein